MGWIVAGIVAVGLPLAAHLLSRRGGRTVIFPAVRFVMRAAAEHARRHRLRDLLLLLMRAGAVVLIALAFDRPVWVARADARAGAGEGRDVVIVLDASASMTRRERGRTLYEVGRDRAAEVLDGLDWSRDRAGVVFVGVEAEAALPRLTANRAALLERLREREVTLERGDLGAALALASALPRALDVNDSADRARRIIVIGDRQRTQWEGEGASAPIGASAEFWGVGPEGTTPNLGVTDLAARPGRALAGHEIVVTARVGNFGAGGRAPRVVLREAGGRALGAATPTIGPDGISTLTFSVVFEEPGVRRLEAALVDGSFTHDDVARTVVEVAAARRVALVTRAREGDMGSAAYFLEAALAPDARARYTVERMRPERLRAGRLDGVAAVVVAESEALDAPAIEVLARYLGAGGGLLWVADSEASASSLLAVAREAGAAPGPAYVEAGTPMEIPGGAGLEGLRFGGDRRGEMEALAGPLEMALRATVFATVSPVRVGEGAQVRARFETGEPFMVDAPVGGGRVVSLHAALDPMRSTVVKSPVFPILVGEIVAVLVGGARDDESAHVGEPVRLDLTGAARAVYLDDRGEPARVVEDGGERLRVALDPVDEPRFVEVRDEGGTVVGVAGVGLDGRESDMRAMTDAEIDAILSGEALAGVRTGAGDPSLIGRRRPIELWGWLMASAVLLLGAEGLLAATSGRRRAGVARRGAAAGGDA